MSPPILVADESHDNEECISTTLNGKSSSSSSPFAGLSSPPSPTLSSSSSSSVERPANGQFHGRLHIPNTRTTTAATAIPNSKGTKVQPTGKSNHMNTSNTELDTHQQRQQPLSPSSSQQQQQIRKPKAALRRQSSSFQEATIQISAGLVASICVILFSLSLPFLISPGLAHEAYQIARWAYDPNVSQFDNTMWTYGTDYLLAIIMVCTAMSIGLQQKQYNYDSGNGTDLTSRLPSLTASVWFSRGLLLMYMLSVTAGGIAHQFFLTTESQNTLAFRYIWTICVGFVTAASTMMGCAGTEYLRLYTTAIKQQQEQSSFDMLQNKLIIIPEWFWVAYSCCTTVIVALGYFSYQSQASDIFVAGITQFPSTFYMIYILLSGIPASPTSSTTTTRKPHVYISNKVRLIGSIGFILNAPLLPMYPVLVKYFTLPIVNTFLHTWLCIAWSIQGYCMKNVIHSFEQYYHHHQQQQHYGRKSN